MKKHLIYNFLANKENDNWTLSSMSSTKCHFDCRCICRKDLTVFEKWLIILLRRQAVPDVLPFFRVVQPDMQEVHELAESLSL